tara:strand:- start:125 stop:337 length:213 start_codon:yes stop_codon:yes gene_type:complete
VVRIVPRHLNNRWDYLSIFHRLFDKIVLYPFSLLSLALLSLALLSLALLSLALLSLVLISLGHHQFPLFF